MLSYNENGDRYGTVGLNFLEQTATFVIDPGSADDIKYPLERLGSEEIPGYFTQTVNGFDIYRGSYYSFNFTINYFANSVNKLAGSAKIILTRNSTEYILSSQSFDRPAIVIDSDPIMNMNFESYLSPGDNIRLDLSCNALSPSSLRIVSGGTVCVSGT